MCKEFDRAIECQNEEEKEDAIRGLFKAWNALSPETTETLHRIAPGLEAAIYRVDDTH